MRTHHGLYDKVLEKDEERDNDRHMDLKKAKLTLTECILALVIALTCVSLHAVFLGMSFGTLYFLLSLPCLALQIYLRFTCQRYLPRSFPAV